MVWERPDEISIFHSVGRFGHVGGEFLADRSGTGLVTIDHRPWPGGGSASAA